jgi:hypothetical protein
MRTSRQLWLTLVSEVAWRLPKRPARMLAQFSQAERGSCYDMLAAAELTETRALRRKYLEHAIDESQHAAVFRKRALALGVSREEAALFDAAYLGEHGIVGGETLFERLGELEFLAFVHISEKRALEQFEVYQQRRLPDDETLSALRRICKDEVFHMTYTGAELERLRKEGEGKAVRAAEWRIFRSRYKEGWLRFSRDLGAVMSGLWLTLLYVLVVGPFKLLARREPEGWRPASHEASLDRARALA